MYHPSIKLLKIVISSIVVVLVIFVLFWLQLPRMLSIKLTDTMKVLVSIDDMHLRPGKITIDNFKISNPKGYTLPYAFTADQIIINAPVTEFFKDNCVINSIDINEIYLGLEFDTITSEDGNWTRLIQNVRQSAIDEQRDIETDETLTIQELNFNNLQTQISYHSQDGKIIDLPIIDHMSFTDISTEGGMPTKQIMDSVLVQMLEEVFIRENINNMLKNIVLLPAQPIRFILAPFTLIFGGGDKETSVPEEESSPTVPLEHKELSVAEDEEEPVPAPGETRIEEHDEPPTDDPAQDQNGYEEEALSEMYNPPARQPGFSIRGDFLYWNAS